MAEINIPIKFINDQQREFFNSPKRNAMACGGFGSGKTYIACTKALFLLTSFNNYRMIIARQTYRDLRRTTMNTFFKICPPELYAPPLGRFSELDGDLRLINGSKVMFMHLDELDEKSLRGIEPNSIFVDQAEEIPESLYYVLDSRVGRWDKAIPSPKFDTKSWPLDHNSNFKVPNYFMLSCNPEDETHWIWRLYHPDSPEHTEKKDKYEYIEFPSTANPCLDPETLSVMLSRDPSWVKRFVYGQWGISEATIHRILPDSIVTLEPEFLKTIITQGRLSRILDHGDSAPTCCLWVSAYKQWHFIYREYYCGGQTIGYHRKQIASLSGDEKYYQNLMDPQCFKEQSQKYGGFWSVAREYEDPTVDGEAIIFEPADNNELATRNRINEMLALSNSIKHPITGHTPAPAIYFIANAVPNALMQTKAARRVKLGEINGKPIFSDERDDEITDHAYDSVRYYVASHMGPAKAIQTRDVKPNSFVAARKRAKLLGAARPESMGFGRFRSA